MSYKVFVSTGETIETFRCDWQGQAQLLFDMAVASKMFTYVSLYFIEDRDFLQREWANDAEQQSGAGEVT